MMKKIWAIIRIIFGAVLALGGLFGWLSSYGSILGTIKNVSLVVGVCMVINGVGSLEEGK